MLKYAGYSFVDIVEIRNWLRLMRLAGASKHFYLDPLVYTLWVSLLASGGNQLRNDVYCKWKIENYYFLSLFICVITEESSKIIKIIFQIKIIKRY